MVLLVFVVDGQEVYVYRPVFADSTKHLICGYGQSPQPWHPVLVGSSAGMYLGRIGRAKHFLHRLTPMPLDLTPVRST
jgi:hypothetical protein